MNNNEINLSNKTFLIAEDHPNMQFLTKTLIERYDGTVILASNGQEAIDLAVSNEDINLIIMDITMPVLDGFKATRALRDRNFQKPIIALTANFIEDFRDYFIQRGFTDFVTKPIVKEEFIGLLHHHISS